MREILRWVSVAPIGERWPLQVFCLALSIGMLMSGTVMAAVLEEPGALVRGAVMWMACVRLSHWLPYALGHRFFQHMTGAPVVEQQDFHQVIRRPFHLLKSCAHPWRVGGLILGFALLFPLAITGMRRVHTWGISPGSYWWLIQEGWLDGLALLLSFLALALILVEGTKGHPWQKVIEDIEVAKGRKKAHEEREAMKAAMAESEVRDAPSRRRGRL